MNVELFSVFDQAAARFIDPFPAPTIEFALRGFQEACETEGHQFQKFPEDYVLYHVGSFHPMSGVIETMEAHKIGMASSYITRGPELDVG